MISEYKNQKTRKITSNIKGEILLNLEAEVRDPVGGVLS